MKVLLIANLVLLTFNSFSQKNSLTFIKNGYSFQTDARTMINYLQIERDSVEYYTNKLIELNSKKPEFSSDTSITIGTRAVSFGDVLQVFDSNHALVTIKNLSDNRVVKYKVKIMKVSAATGGIGGTSETYLIIKDKRKKVEIVREIIRRSLAC